MHARAKKNYDRLNFGGSRFLRSEILDLAISIYFKTISVFSVTRRAGFPDAISRSDLFLPFNSPGTSNFVVAKIRCDSLR